MIGVELQFDVLLFGKAFIRQALASSQIVRECTLSWRFIRSMTHNRHLMFEAGAYGKGPAVGQRNYRPRGTNWHQQPSFDRDRAKRPIPSRQHEAAQIRPPSQNILEITTTHQDFKASLQSGAAGSIPFFRGTISPLKFPARTGVSPFLPLRAGAARACDPVHRHSRPARRRFAGCGGRE